MTSTGGANAEEDNSNQVSQGAKSNVFDWQVDEEVLLIIFKRQENKVTEYFSNRN